MVIKRYSLVPDKLIPSCPVLYFCLKQQAYIYTPSFTMLLLQRLSKNRAALYGINALTNKHSTKTMVGYSELLLHRAPQQWIAFAIFVDTHCVPFLIYITYSIRQCSPLTKKKNIMPTNARAKACHRLLSHEYFGVLSHSQGESIQKNVLD